MTYTRRVVKSRLKRRESGIVLSEQLEIAKTVLEVFLRKLFLDEQSPVYWGKQHAAAESAQISSVRIKSVESITDKIERKRQKKTEWTVGQIFDSLTDLVGARVVFTTAEEAKKAGDFINIHFHVDDFSSGDKAEINGDTVFGYLSIHHIVILKGDFFKNREHRTALGFDERTLKRYEQIFSAAPLRVEIQIRSLLQHAWAEVAHNAIYKPGNMVVPQESRRRLNSIAAVLEHADNSINDFMYLFNAQSGSDADKYLRIARELKNKKIDAISAWDRYSLRSLLFEVDEFLKFHKDDFGAMVAKIMAKILLWDRNINFNYVGISSRRKSADQFQLNKLKDRRDDILNTLMLLIKSKQDLSMLKDFNPFEDEGEGRLLVDTIHLAIKLATSGKSSAGKEYVFWACDTKLAKENVRQAIFNALGELNLSEITSLCMIHPTSKKPGRKTTYQYDDSDQLAKVLPGDKKLFCCNITYDGEHDDWAPAVFDRTAHERYSLYEPLHALEKLKIDPKKIRFIGCNLQRMENTLCRFAIAVGARTLILKHPEMSRFRSVLFDPEWSGCENVTEKEISPEAIKTFLKRGK